MKNARTQVITKTLEGKIGLAAAARRDRRPLYAACGFAFGFALAIAAATLWALSLAGHDDGRDVAILLIAAFACFGLGAHLMDCVEHRRD